MWSYNCKQVPVGFKDADKRTEEGLLNVFTLGFSASLLRQVRQSVSLFCFLKTFSDSQYRFFHHKFPKVKMLLIKPSFFALRSQSYKTCYISPPSPTAAPLCGQCAFKPRHFSCRCKFPTGTDTFHKWTAEKDGMTGRALATVSEESDSGLGRWLATS